METPHLDRLELHAQGRRGLNGLPGNRGERVGRIEQRDHARQRRHRLREEFEPLPLQVRRQRGQSGHVATGLRQARHQASRHWVPSDRGDDRDGLGRVHGREGAGGAGREDDVRLQAHKLCDEARITFLVSLSPLVRDDEILSLHVAELTEALTKGVDLV
jgi:hypothetical protein